MHHRLLTLLSCLALLATPLANGVAQDGGERSAEHRGFWIGFGLGGGVNFAEWAKDTRGGVGAYLRLGGTVSQHLLLGGEIIGWGRNRDAGTFSESGVTAIAMFYPARAGLFLKGGAGFAGWAVSAPPGATASTQTAGGFAGTLGVGYDLQIGGNLFLTPNVDFLYHTISSENTAFADLSSGTVLLFTLGLTWH